MAHFSATGTITTDIVRKETRNGVLATFRVSAGQPGRGQVWIEVEAWGHLAGVIDRHASRDQHVTVAGRLTQKTWHDRASGQARRRYVVTAADIDLLHDISWAPQRANTVIASGIVDTPPTTRPAGTGTVCDFVLRSGRAGAKTGRLWLRVEHWTSKDQPAIAERQAVVVQGRLAYRHPVDGTTGNPYYLAATNLCAPATAAQPTQAASR